MKLLIIVLILTSSVTLMTLVTANSNDASGQPVESHTDELVSVRKWASIFTDTRAFQVHFFDIIELFARNAQKR